MNGTSRTPESTVKVNVFVYKDTGLGGFVNGVMRKKSVCMCGTFQKNRRVILGAENINIQFGMMRKIGGSGKKRRKCIAFEDGQKLMVRVTRNKWKRF